MAQTIKLKRSSQAGRVPSTSSLSLGEVAINTYDGKVYIKKNDGSDAIVEIGASTSAVWNSYDYTATSSQTSFTGSDNNSATLSYVPGFLQVFLNGVLLDPAVDYAATTGNSVVLTIGATTSDLLQIETFTQIIGTGDILVDTFPVSSTQTAFTLSQDPINKNNISVYVEGVYQESSTYSLSTTTLTLSESPANGTTVEVVIGTRNVTLDGIVDLTISGTLHAGALDLGDANIINVNEISLDTIKGDADANTNITFAGSDVTTFTQGGQERLRLNTTGAEVTGDIVVSGNVDGRDVAADGATADAALSRAGGAMGGPITTSSTFDGRDVSVDGTKLDGIESGATADQTDVEIRAAVESASDSNVFTNADHSKLDGIEALADVTDVTNVTAAGALMDSEVTNLAQVKAFDSSDYATAAQGTTANAALPKAGGTMTGDLTLSGGHDIHLLKTHANDAVDMVYGQFTFGDTTSGQYVNHARIESGGTYANQSDLRFHTSSNNSSPERMRITNTGNVGIGTASPQALLDVTADSNADTGTVSAPVAIRITDTNDGGNTTDTTNPYAALQFFSRDTSNEGPIVQAQVGVIYDDVYAAGSHLTFSTWNAGVAAAAEKMRITSAGNVGIGTNIPVGNLHIVGGDGVNGSSTIGGSSNDFIIENNSNAGMTIRSGANENGVISFADPDSHNVGQFYYMHDIDAMRFTTNGAVQMTVDSAGTVDVANDLLANNAKLKAIAASNTDTAVDVFVYDTRKDSDGGAWRKRTQNTSWYNETLNTSTRGARKEFPSVAVIVAEAATITIYDGDDPDMPMWMVFANSSGDVYMRQPNTSSIAMLNSQMVWGDASYDLFSVRFVDEQYWMKNNGTTYENGYSGSIVKRNIAGALIAIDSLGIVNRAVNDVAMTVLPNAPIDAATGLPAPTIAVATDGGVSVIKDDGTVVDWVAGSHTHSLSLSFRAFDNALVFTNGGNATQQAWIRALQIPSADISQNNGYNDSFGNEMHCVLNNSYTGQDMALPVGNDYNASPDVLAVHDQMYLGGNRGLTIVDSNLQNHSQGLISHITSDYNTGWMVGDIKLATLSDTDTTNVTGSELSNVSSFTDLSGTGNSVSESGGTVTGTHAGSGGLCHYKGALFSTVAGNTYTVVLNHTSGSTCSFRVKDGGNDATIVQKSGLSTVGIVSITFTATSTSAYMDFFNNSQFIFNSLSIRSGEFDRSYNANGLQVFGTVTKTAVATGADLVGYSGFSASNYLTQPNNSDFEFGTGDWSMMGWITQVSGGNSTQHPIQLGLTSGSSSEISIIRQTASSPTILGFRVRGDTNSYAAYPVGGLISANVWTHFVLTKSGSQLLWYINGELIHSTTSSTVGNIGFSSSDVLRIGHGASTVTGDEMKLALLRISATAPSAEQIAKMYNDEKHLFSTNAKATLYGTSDAVTALAYDDDTELLHVGTSAGRSEFQGLNRVNNTTDAVGTAISASNGFIVEE